MKNGITIAFLSLGLIACGGESNNSNNNRNQSPQASIDTEFAQDFRGSQTLPSLTEISVTEGDSLSIDTKASGNILEGSSVNLIFTAEKSGLMTMFSLSPVAGVKFILINNNDSTKLLSQGRTDFPEFYDDQNVYGDHLLFTAVEGLSYSIEITSSEESADFKLVITDGNRHVSSLLNNPDTYIISETYEETKECNTVNERGQFIDTTSSSDTYHNFSIMNWKLGYHIKNISSYIGTAFDDAKDDTFYVGDEFNGFEDYLVYLTNFETGEVSSHGLTILAYTDATTKQTQNCRVHHTMTGKIVL
jgi:hypothetical protein